MSQVMVWKSDADGRLFEDKTKYTKHLRILARDRNNVRKQLAVKATREAFLARMGQVASFDELKLFIKDNWEWFHYNGSAKEWANTKKSKPHTLVSVEFGTLYFGDQSNSHSCPRGPGFGQNWGGHYADRPRSYPGWTTHLTFEVQTPAVGKRFAGAYGSDYFNDTLIDTGGGGGSSNNSGLYKYNYSLTLWANDFPVIEENRKQQLTINKLLGIK